MKIIAFLFSGCLLTAVLIFSCQKPFNPQDPAQSAGTLAKDNNGNCQPANVNGIYLVNSALTASHYIEVSVTVSSPGNYAIGTDTLDGMHFGDTAFFSGTGSQLVRLKGYGTPVTAGVFPFVVHYGTASSCSVPVSVSAISTQAVFTLTGDPGACTNPLIQGAYTAGTALGIANKLVISANVTSPGTYNLSTAVVNGISFSASGVFSATGTQTVTLSGAGTPLSAGTNQLVVSGTATSCSFPLTVSSGVPPGDTAKAIFLSNKELDAVNNIKKISLTCYNPDNSVRWKRTSLGTVATENNASTYLNITPSIEYNNGVVYYCVDSVFASGTPTIYYRYNFFYAMDVNTGNDIWRRRSTVDYIQNPIVRNGVIYCNLQNSSGNNVAAFSAADGSLLWKQPIPDAFGANYLELEGNTLYYVSSLSNYTSQVNAFDITTKSIIWKKNIGLNGDAYSKMINTNGLLILKSGNYTLVALDKITGNLVWSKPNIVTNPKLVNNLIYCENSNKEFGAYGPADGSLKYLWPNSLNIGSATYVQDDRFYFTGMDPNSYQYFIACYNALSASPAQIWSVPYPDPDQLETPVVAGNTVYGIKRTYQPGSGNYTYKMMMFDRNTGAPKDSVINTSIGVEIGVVGILKSSGIFVEPSVY
ncbi:MAG: PQQ-binding-like beta-propeller repeat protein [Ferruginibacter sp.]